MQCFKCQAHGHIAANCENVQRCPKCFNQNVFCSANRNEKHSAEYKGCKKNKEVKQQACAASYAEALKNKPESTDKERAQKITSDARKQIEKKIRKITSNFSKYESKIEQITKSSNEQLRVDLQSQIDQLSANLQSLIALKEKARENIRKTVMEDITKVLCELLKDTKMAVDEGKMGQKLNKLNDNRTKNQNTQH